MCNTLYIKTANGKTELIPIHCGVTNIQIGWRTNTKNKADTVYISFNAVTYAGVDKGAGEKIVTF